MDQDAANRWPPAANRLPRLASLLRPARPLPAKFGTEPSGSRTPGTRLVGAAGERIPARIEMGDQHCFGLSRRVRPAPDET